VKGNDSVASSQTFLILILVIFSLIFGCILTANTTIGIDAFAKKNSKTSSFDKASGRGSGNGSRDKASDTTSDMGKQEGEPTVPLPVETPTNSKFVIINFDDSHQSDYTYAKPILDKYGFKATFFEVCNWVEAGYHDKDISITWQQIAALQEDGMDIEAHTMTHPNLNDLSQADLNYEIGQSKQCLENHGFNPTIFAY
jgi:polysaccharide deacetylase